jgi:hypothetical protein
MIALTKRRKSIHSTVPQVTRIKMREAGHLRAIPLSSPPMNGRTLLQKALTKQLIKGGKEELIQTTSLDEANRKQESDS